jgi:hypothetical protein
VLAFLSEKDIPEWLEEVKESKTIHDLEDGSVYYFLTDSLKIIKDTKVNYIEYDVYSSFVTEREAKRNKLLRQLATRTDKWLPNKNEYYLDYEGDKCMRFNDTKDITYYNL